MPPASTEFLPEGHTHVLQDPGSGMSFVPIPSSADAAGCRHAGPSHGRLEMLTVDGAHGEGGGQIIRNAVALSALTGTPIRIVNIRANRKKPGLFPQHMAAVRAVACTCGAQTEGLLPGSSLLTFVPEKISSCSTSVEVGTAGCIPLVIQAWLTPALDTGGELRVTGGTEVPLGPTVDYMDRVFLPCLRASGASIRVEILSRGYYPAGGGSVVIQIEKKPLSPIHPQEKGDMCVIVSCSSNLPAHVAERQAVSAGKILEKETCGHFTVETDIRTGKGTGSSCTIYRGCKGGSSLGHRGLPAERVGEAAAREALSAFQSPGSIDVHLSDQLLLPLALYGGTFSSASLTPHAETTLWLLEQFGFSVHVHQDNGVEFSA